MRQARIKGEGLSYYHCLSRVVDRRFILGEIEKEHFVALMRKLEAFHGMRVVTYCIMSNHFHLLVEEPDRESLPPLDRETLLKRLGFLYSKNTVRDVREELDRAREAGNTKWEQEVIQRYEQRMGDLSQFMKALKQRFSQWYNKRAGRRGTLWEDRYKSLLVEGDRQALITVAAYIELNPIRAGLVSRVEDYRWCGYASALGGNRWAREGLLKIWKQSPAISASEDDLIWENVSPEYRLWFYQEGAIGDLVEPNGKGGKPAKHGFDEATVENEVDNRGKLTPRALLKHRIRYFSDGAVLGSAEFVDQIFAREKKRLGLKRKTGARRMKDADWGNLRVMRDLQGSRLG